MRLKVVLNHIIYKYVKRFNEKTNLKIKLENLKKIKT
jgi:hypothetical protein